MSPILKQLGLTPEAIAKYVVKIETMQPWSNKTRANRRESGLAQNTGRVKRKGYYERRAEMDAQSKLNHEHTNT